MRRSKFKFKCVNGDIFSGEVIPAHDEVKGLSDVVKYGSRDGYVYVAGPTDTQDVILLWANIVSINIERN